MADMVRKLVGWTALLTIAMIAPISAQGLSGKVCVLPLEAEPAPQAHERAHLASRTEPDPGSCSASDQPDRRAFTIPRTNHVVVLGDDKRLLSVAVAQDLLDAITTWIATDFDLPNIRSLPRIEIVPAARINAMHYGRLLPDSAPAESTPPSRSQGDIVAVYSDAARTIYLPEGWTGSTAADLSVLVHEMVHHLQNLAALKYQCPQEREALAYRAQERWLGLFGRGLAQDFQIDGFSLLVKTRCMY
jgi:hypothetical protein